MASTGTVVYTDPEGKKKTGYYKDGTTYADEGYAAQVPVGSIVDTAGGTYYKTSSGGVKIGEAGGLTSYLGSGSYSEPSGSERGGDSGDLRDQIDSTYDRYLKEQLDAIEAEKAKIDPYYYGVRNNAATVQSQNQNAFNEYAAANGLNAGAGGQAALARQNVYGNAINSADVAEANAYADVESQVRQLKAHTQMQKDQALAEEMARREAAQQAEDQFNTNVALTLQTNKQTQDNYLAELEQNKLLNAAQILASGGNFSGYQALYGLTDEQVSQLQQAYTAQNTPKSSGGGSSGGGGGKSLTFSQAKALADDGYLTDSVVGTLLNYFSTDELMQMYPELSGGGSSPAGSKASSSSNSAVTTTGAGGAFISPSSIAKNQLTGNVPSETTLVQMLSSGQIDEAGFISAMNAYGYDWTKYAQ